METEAKLDRESLDVAGRASKFIMDELQKNVQSVDESDLMNQTVCMNLLFQGIHQVVVACHMLQERCPEATSRSVCG